MDPQVSVPWYLDKSFYLTVFTALCALVASIFGVHLDPVALAGLAVAVAAVVAMFIKASKEKQATIIAAQIAAQAAADAKAPPSSSPEAAAANLGAVKPS